MTWIKKIKRYNIICQHFKLPATKILHNLSDQREFEIAATVCTRNYTVWAFTRNPFDKLPPRSLTTSDKTFRPLTADSHAPWAPLPQDCRVLCTRNTFPAHVPASCSYFPAELAQRVAISITGAETTTAGVPVPVASILLAVLHGPERTSLKTLRPRFVCNTRATTTLLMQPNHPPTQPTHPNFTATTCIFFYFYFLLRTDTEKHDIPYRATDRECQPGVEVVASRTNSCFCQTVVVAATATDSGWWCRWLSKKERILGKKWLDPRVQRRGGSYQILVWCALK